MSEEARNSVWYVCGSVVGWWACGVCVCVYVVCVCVCVCECRVSHGVGSSSVCQLESKLRHTSGTFVGLGGRGGGGASV